MKKMMYKTMSILCSMSLCLSFAACSDDDDQDENGDDITIVLTDAEMDAVDYDLLLDALAPYEIADGTSQRVVQVGTCLFPTYADEYYAEAESYAEAKDLFLNSLLPEDLKDRVKTAGKTLTLSLLDATITFQEASGEGKVAVIDFDVPKLAGLKTLYYIQSTAWPANATAVSPFREGEICRDAKGNYYFCAKKADRTSGILVTVNQRKEETLNPDAAQNCVQLKGESCGLYTNNAVREAFNDSYSVVKRFDYATPIENLNANYTDAQAQEMYAFLTNLRDKRTANYIMGSPTIKGLSTGSSFLYYIKFSYYQCADATVSAFDNMKMKGYPIPYGYLGSSQISFDANYDRTEWTTVVESPY
jgi:hypothetical protein